jgi:hypothetical protein
MQSNNEPSPNEGNNFYPILIIPGFMSSGLEVKESKDSPSWVSKRVWINLTSIGFASIFRGGTLERNESIRGKAGFSEEKHKEFEKQRVCKSKWLHHMSLSNDMVTERPGVKVRPISGLAGVDYLTPGALTEHLSYVFGPVIDALQAAGYNNMTLDAAPYDWRLPPSELENRDHYFSETMVKIEDMYRRNNNTPVVLLCHSLGCKTGHYLLNFAKDHPKGGKDWIKKYIYAYMPVGAPHLGAAKALRGLVDGDKMGLDAFLSDEEGLILGRSLGSVPWLVPRILPADVPPMIFIRTEGILEITVPPIDCTSLLHERRNDPPKLRLAIIFGKDVLTSDFQDPINTHGKLIYEFPGTFTFPTLVQISKDREGLVQFALQEPGLKAAKQEEEEEELFDPIHCLFEIVCCPIKYILCLPCTLLCCGLRKTFEVTRDVTLAGADMTATLMGAGSNIAHCKQFYLADVLGNCCDAQVRMTLLLDNDFKRQANIFAKLKWIPPKSTSSEAAEARAKKSPMGLVSDQSATANLLTIGHKSKNHVRYEIIDGCELLTNEGMGRTLDFVHTRYESDSLGPRTRSAADAPPVDRVIAIFGVNRPTEVGAVYRRRALVVQPGNQQKLEKLHRLDSSSRITTFSKAGGKIIKGGAILETKTADSKSGDGTVPYFSMEHCRKWQSKACDVKVIELEGADHREILADERFHSIVLDNVTIKK